MANEDILAEASEYLAEDLRAHASRDVLYVRGGLTATISASVGATIGVVRDEQGPELQTQVRDYLIRVADLVLGAQATEPARGDRIIETDDGVSRTYEVLPIGREKCWRYADPFRVQYRVHTKLVSVT